MCDYALGRGRLVLVPKATSSLASSNPSRAPIGHHGLIEVGVKRGSDVRHAWQDKPPTQIQVGFGALCFQGPYFQLESVLGMTDVRSPCFTSLLPPSVRNNHGSLNAATTSAWVLVWETPPSSKACR